MTELAMAVQSPDSWWLDFPQAPRVDNLTSSLRSPVLYLSDAGLVVWRCSLWMLCSDWARIIPVHIGTGNLVLVYYIFTPNADESGR